MKTKFYEVKFNYTNTIYHVAGETPKQAAERALINYIKDGGKFDSCLEIAVTEE